MKNIRDYIHFYIGCQIIGTYNDASGSKGYLTGITNGNTECEIQFVLEDGINVEEEPQWNHIKEIKLILRELSDMTEEEIKEFKEMIEPSNIGRNMLPLIRSSEHTNYFMNANDPYMVAWFISKGFDVFGLIKDGLAIKA